MTAPTSTPLLVRAVSKSYAGRPALERVDLAVVPGSVHGLLGPNGAGKTTLLRLVFGLVAPDSGVVSAFGAPPGPGALEGVGGFVETPAFYPYLSGRANLRLLARLDGVGGPEGVESALRRVDLHGRAGERVAGYSFGMRQRLGIAAALLRRPRLLVLDEPANGLDPAGVRDLRALVRELADDGAAVLLSSHDMTAVEELCDTVTVLAAGRVVYTGGLDQLRRDSEGDRYLLSTSDDAVVNAVAPACGVAVAGGAEGLAVTGSQAALDSLVLELGRRGVAVRSLTRTSSSLEARFLTLTGSSP